jgi:hypothetical protein
MDNHLTLQNFGSDNELAHAIWMNKWLRIAIISLLLALFFVGQVYARGENFIIEPNHEVTETIPLTVSSSVTGNVSANGKVDFYVNSPSGAVIYCANKTTFNPFSFVANENGNYTIHVINSNQENVTSILNYNIHLVVVLQEKIGVNFNVAATVIPATATSIDWVTLIESLFGIGSVVELLLKIRKGIRKFVEWFRWWKKYRKSRTPVVIQIIDP